MKTPDIPEAVASYTRIAAITVPVILSNLAAPLTGLVDSAVIGQAGDPVSLAAIGLSALLYTSTIVLFSFLGFITTSGIARGIGQNDIESQNRHLARMLVFALGLGSFLAAMSWGLPSVLVDVMAPAADVASGAVLYLTIRFLGAPFFLVWRVLAGRWIAMEKTGAILGIDLLMQGTNMALTLLLVLGLGWGLAGAAMASVLAEILACIIAILVQIPAVRAAIKTVREVISDGALFRRIFVVSGYIFGRTAIMQLIMLSFAWVGTSLGTEVLAVNQVLLLLTGFISMATDGLSVAAETLTGQAIGRRDARSMDRNIIRVIFLSGGIALFFFVFFQIFGDRVFAIISPNEDLRAIADNYMIWVSLVAIFGVVPWILDGVYFGAARGRDIFLAMLVSTCGYLLTLAITLPLFGNHGLWLALILSYFYRTAALGFFYPGLRRDVVAGTA